MKKAPLLAVPAILFLILPIPSLAQSPKGDGSNAKRTIKVLGIHCAEAQGEIVGLQLCQEIIDRIRRMAPYLTVRNCPDVLDKNKELEVRCLPKDDADTMLVVLRNWDLYDNGQTPVGMLLYTVGSNRHLLLIPGVWGVCLDIGPDGMPEHTTEGSTSCGVNKVVLYVGKRDMPAPKTAPKLKTKGGPNR